MILLDAVVEATALADANPFRSAPGTIPQPVVGIAGDNRFAVGLAAVDDDPLGPAMAFKRIPEKPPGRQKVAVFAEPNSTYHRSCRWRDKGSPLVTDLDVGFVDMPSAGYAQITSIETLQQLRRVADGPAVNCRMVDGYAALRHHLLQVAQAQAVGRYQRTQNKITYWSK